jgi:flagellar hook-basal body complex protein FliE
MNIDPTYNAAMSKIVPGSFVPDIASSPKTEAIPEDATGAIAGASFKDTVKSFLGDVSDKVATSDQLSRDYAVGKTNDVNKVVTSVEEASLALQFTMAIRNKLMDAYTEISRMQV